MNTNKDFEKQAINRERNKSKYDRYLNFEQNLRYCFPEVEDELDREDDFLLDDIKQTIIVYAMKNDFSEGDDVFLSDIKDDFYRATRELRERHRDLSWKMKVIEMFMEDFYFSK